MRDYPYGGARYISGAPPTTFRYTGQRQQPNADELYFYNTRWYDPLSGRFLSPDTLVLDPTNLQGLNRYAYGLGNPVKYTDPSGHVPIPFPWLQQLGELLQKLVLALSVQAAPVTMPITQYGPQLTQYAQDVDAASHMGTGEGGFGDPGQWDPNDGPKRESRVRQALSGRYLQSYGESDAEIRRNLGIEGKTADFVGCNEGNYRWLIAESKGGDMLTASKQLENTMNGLLKKTGVTSVDIDLRIYTTASNFQKLISHPNGLGYYYVREGYLGWLDEAGQWVWATINGVRIGVEVAP